MTRTIFCPFSGYLILRSKLVKIVLFKVKILVLRSKLVKIVLFYSQNFGFKVKIVLFKVKILVIRSKLVKIGHF